MVEECVIIVELLSGQVVLVYIIMVVSDGECCGGLLGWFVGIVVLLVLIVGIYFFIGLLGSEIVKDNVIVNVVN